LVHELHASEYVRHDSPFPINNPDDYLRFIRSVRDAFHDLTFKVEDIVAENDRVLVRWTASATHKSEWAGVAATGKNVKVIGMDLLVIVNGKITESWGMFDALGVLQQIGAFPIPGKG
jgi:steroid delta-isomerase-like uncharacterized protein